MTTPRIDPELCTGCGSCMPVCPHGTLGMNDGVAHAVRDHCMRCGHCAAACPTQAITLTELDWPAFTTFSPAPGWTPPGDFPPSELARLLLSRRSCRSFDPEPPSSDVLQDLVAFAVTAPSGTNSQAWTFTLLPDRPAVERLARPIAGFFRKLNKQAANPLLRRGLKLIGRPELDDYHCEYADTVAAALRQWDEEGRDLLFHDAPAVMVVGSRPEASCPAEDALLATQNATLGAHALGLGCCLIGYAVAAMHRDRSIQDSIGIPRDETVHAVIALGWPRERYQRPAGRRKPIIRWVK